jgi:hypothetical protein
MYKKLSQNDLKKMRQEYLKENGKCQILGVELDENTIVIDHAHRKRKSDEINEENGGLIRGIIHRQLNAFIGKIENNYRRYGLHNFISLPELLRKIADYIENPPLYHQKLIHPSEKLPEKKLGKREFKKFKEYLIQKYPRRKSLQNLEYFSKIPKKFKDDYEEFLKIYKKS